MARSEINCRKHGRSYRVTETSPFGARVTRCEKCVTEERFPGGKTAARLHTVELMQRLGSTSNPPPGPLSQGGDT